MASSDFTVPSTLFSGTADSYSLPNYVDELFDLMPQITPFTNLIGGLNGGREVASRDFVWEVEDGEAASATNQRIENATVTGDLVPRQAVSNVVEIHQEAVSFGFTAQAVTGAIASDAPNAATDTVLGDQPVMDPMQHQINKKMGKIKRDVEMSFIQGTYAAPTTNATARRTRGIIEAIDLHEVDYTAGSYTSIRDAIDDLLLDMVAPTNEADAAVMQDVLIMVNPVRRKGISADYSNDGALAPRDRTVGGVSIDKIMTEQGEFGIMSNRYVPAGTLLVLDLSVIRPVFLPHPEYGNFFVQPLGRTGAKDEAQIYGEIGLEYGPETYHGKITLIT